MMGGQGFNGSSGEPDHCMLTDPQTFLICVQIRTLCLSVVFSSVGLVGGARRVAGPPFVLPCGAGALGRRLASVIRILLVFAAVGHHEGRRSY